MPTLKVKNNGVWERVMGGSGNVSTESGSLIVNLDTKTMTASHGASEIYNAIQSGKIVSAMSDSNMMYNIFMYSPENIIFIMTVVESGNIDNYAEATYVFLSNDKNFSFASQKINGLPNGGTVGQALTIDTNGNPVWSTVSSNNSNSNIFIVTIYNGTTNMTASHSVSEINAAVLSGNIVFAQFNIGKMYVPLVYIDETDAVFGQSVTDHIIGDKTTDGIYLTVKEDKSVISSTTTVIGVPAYAESDYGKFMTPSADGLKWVNAPNGGSIGEGTQVQVDYNQNDSSAVDYIKNRPFYAETTTIFDQDITTTNIDIEGISIIGYMHPKCIIDTSTAKNGDYYVVKMNDTTYECKMDSQMIGNMYIFAMALAPIYAEIYGVSVEEMMAILSEDFENTGEPFLIGFNYTVQDDGTIDEFTMIAVEEAGTYHVTIDGGVIHKLDSKFLNTDELLPNVTANNNGQVLGVVNGKWAATEAASGLPKVTTVDNDKALIVVDGVWVASSIANGDEVYY
jgi:hypothetical protein